MNLSLVTKRRDNYKDHKTKILSQMEMIIKAINLFQRQKYRNLYINTDITPVIQMSTKLDKLLSDFRDLCLNNNQQNPNIQTYLKTKSLQFQTNAGQVLQDKTDWKCWLIQSYSYLARNDTIRQRMMIVCEQLISQYQKSLQNKDLQLYLIKNEMSLMKASLQQEKSESQKIYKQHEEAIEEQIAKTHRALQRLQYKQLEIRDLQAKLSQFEGELEEIKSDEYQKMLDSIKQEQIFTSQAQNLYKQNALIKFQLKQANTLKNQLYKQSKSLNEQLEQWRMKYQKARLYIQKRFLTKERTQSNTPTLKHLTDTNKHEQTINLIEYKEEFSFKDSIQNDNQTTVQYNNCQNRNRYPNFLDFDYDKSCDLFANENQVCNVQREDQQSPQRCLTQRDILNLTHRQKSTKQKKATKNILRNKKDWIVNKENISQNTLEIDEFQQYQSINRVSHFGSKRNLKNKGQTSNCSSDKNVSSSRRFGTQEKGCLLNNRHRGIKSSFCGQSIEEFQQCENKHFFVNSQKFNYSIFEQQDNQTNNNNNVIYCDESCILQCDVNEIVINQQLIMSNKPKLTSHIVQSQYLHMLNQVQAKMVTSVQVTQANQITLKKQKQLLAPGLKTQTDIYYAFFSLTAQCVKLNAKNFDKAISIYFNLEQQYSNVIKKTIPINKWYNYIQDQIQMAIKYII